MSGFTSKPRSPDHDSQLDDPQPAATPGKVSHTGSLDAPVSERAASSQPATSGSPPVQLQRGQSVEAWTDAALLGRSPSAPAGAVVQREGAQEDEVLTRARKALSDTLLFASEAERVLKSLIDRTDAAAVQVRTELQARCKRERIFWDEYRIKSAQKLIEAHQNGTDEVRYTGPSFLVYEAIATESFAKISGDQDLVQLAQDIDFLQSFYLDVNIYGKDLPGYHGRIRMMQSFLAAGQPVDWWDFWECNNWLDRDVFSRLLNPYLNHRILAGSNALKAFKDCYNDWQAVKLQMEQKNPENPYDETGRGKVKTDIMAINAPTPEYKPVDRDQTRVDWDDAMKRGEELLTQRDVFPGDLHTAIQKLKMLRDHSPYEWDQPKVDALVRRLEAKLVETDDPEAVRALRGGPSSEVEFDASKPFGVDALTSVLNKIANEPGESGKLAFKIAAKGTIGTGLINAYVKGWAELALSYAVSDTLTCVMGFDVDAAIGAGISLAGLVEAGGEVGGGFGMKARFSKPGEVAYWIFQQMQAVNEKAGVAIFPLIGGTIEPGRVNPTVLTEKSGFAKGELSADIGVAAANAEVKGEKKFTTFSKDGEDSYGTTDTTSFSAGALARLGAITLKGGYTFTGDHVVGDINPANNGEYHNHKVNIGFGLSRSVTKNPTATVPPQKIQDGILDFFASLEGRMPGGVPRQVLHGAFDSVVKQIYDACEYGKKYSSGIDIDITFEWHNEKMAADEAYHMQYFRVSLTPTLSASVGKTTKAGGVEIGVSASKTENVFEMIGTENWSYVFQQYKFQWTPEQWDEFVDAHKSRLGELMTNMLDPTKACYDARFAELVQGATGFEQRVEALEKFFDQV